MKEGEVMNIAVFASHGGSDLQAIMEYKANNADYRDMLEMGISEEELALIASYLNP